MGAINFEDVYANAYVRESVETLVEMTVRQYPMLASYEDDIRQELWIAIARRISRFNANMSSIDTFCRRVMNNALKDIRRRYFSGKSISTRNTVELDDVDSRGGEPGNDYVDRAMLIADVRAVLATLSPIQKSICEMIMDGCPIREISERHNIPIVRLYRHYLNPLKKFFAEAGLQK